MTKEELRKRFIETKPVHLNGSPLWMRDYAEWLEAEIEKRDKEIDSWEEEVLKLGEETEKLEIKLIQYKNGLDIICTNYKKRIKELETQLSYYADKNQKQDE